MKKLKDLTPEERKIHDQAIMDAFAPLEVKGIVERSKRFGNDVWMTTVNPAKLEEAVRRFHEEKTGSKDTIIIGGCEVLLTVSIFILNICNESSEEKTKELDRYLAEFE